MADTRDIGEQIAQRLAHVRRRLPHSLGDISRDAAVDIVRDTMRGYPEDDGDAVGGWADGIQKVRNIKVDDAIGAEITNEVEHSIYIEYGTAHMAARPHLRRAIMDAPQHVSRAVQRSVVKLFHGDADGD